MSDRIDGRLPSSWDAIIEQARSLPHADILVPIYEEARAGRITPEQARERATDATLKFAGRAKPPPGRSTI